MGHYEYFFIRLNDDTAVLDATMDRFGQFLDITIDHMGMDPEEAIIAFTSSGLSRAFEIQSIPFVMGKSGSELVEWALGHSGRTDLVDKVPFDAQVGFNVPYWIGEMVAYFQAKNGLTYKRIFKCIPYKRFDEMYCAYNECVPEDFAQVIARVIEECPWESELKRFRGNWKMTQAELAHRAGVSIRSIQQYEQGVKDIRKASADTVYRLSIALRCTMEDLIC